MTGDVSDLFSLLRGDIQALRTEVNSRFDQLVTKSEHRADMRRADDRHDALAQDLADAQRAAEKAATENWAHTNRVVAEERAAREEAYKKTDERSFRTQGAMRWTVMAVLTAAGVAAAFLAVVFR